MAPTSSLDAFSCLTSAPANGELRPGPSSATLPGWVEKLMSVPAPASMGQAAPDLSGARAHGAGEVARQGIVPAGIEKQDVGLGLPLHRPVHEFETHHLEVQGRKVPQLGVHRHQIIVPRHLQPMARIEEHRHLGALQRTGEVAHCWSNAALSRSKPSMT